MTGWPKRRGHKGERMSERDDTPDVPDVLEPVPVGEPRATVVAIGPVLGRDLVPGDLFSTVGPDYWSGALDQGSLAERAFIRTNTPASHGPDPDAPVYRLIVTVTRAVGS